MKTLEDLGNDYNRYVDTFREADGRLPPMMELKRVHTGFVVENAKLVADGEAFGPDERYVALAAAQLHDAGRYEQLRRYDTFRDSESVDHAEFSCEIVEKNGWLDCREREILDAIRFHNKRCLPDGLDPLTFTAANAVRDADKLDIFRVLEDQIKNCDWRGDPRVFWNLPVDVPPSADVLKHVRDGKPVDYQNIRSLADFVLIQIGWIKSGLYFAVSRRLAAERRHLEFRLRFLREIGAETADLDFAAHTGGEI